MRFVSLPLHSPTCLLQTSSLDRLRLLRPETKLSKEINATRDQSNPSVRPTSIELQTQRDPRSPQDLRVAGDVLANRLQLVAPQVEAIVAGNLLLAVVDVDRGRGRGRARSLPGPDRPLRALGLRGRSRRRADAAAGGARRHQGRAGLEPGSFNDHRCGDGEVHPAGLGLVGWTDGRPEASAQGAPGGAFELHAGPVHPGGFFDRHVGSGIGLNCEGDCLSECRGRVLKDKYVYL